jgi:hypothetical protein
MNYFHLRVLTTNFLEITVASLLVNNQFGYGVSVIDPPASKGFLVALPQRVQGLGLSRVKASGE